MLDILVFVIAAHACMTLSVALELRGVRDQLANLDYDLMQLASAKKDDTTE